ncbi:hypothetical protein ABPG75_002233 [Micractinium tetrahymenae]
MNTCTPLLALALLGLASVLPPTDATIVAGALLPHGDIALDPARDPALNSTQRRQATELHAAALQAGKFLQDASPELIFLATPHGVADLERHAFFLNPTAAGCLDPLPALPGGSGSATGATAATAAGAGAEGSAEAQLSPAQQQLGHPGRRRCTDVSVAVGTSVMLLKFLRDRTFQQTTGLSGFGPPGEAAAPFPLGWDELRGSARFLLLSFPSRRYNESVQMAPEVLDMGMALWDALEALPQRVAVLVSGDLAHTHDPAGPYGFSKDAAPFDAAVGRWADSLRADELLGEAARRQHGAKSCGFLGMVMLHGMLHRGMAAALDGAAAALGSSARGAEGQLSTSVARAGTGAPGQQAAGQRSLQEQQWPPADAGGGVPGTWRGRLLALQHPTYYGMAVATFERLGLQAVAVQ